MRTTKVVDPKQILDLIRKNIKTVQFIRKYELNKVKQLHASRNFIKRMFLGPNDDDFINAATLGHEFMTKLGALITFIQGVDGGISIDNETWNMLIRPYKFIGGSIEAWKALDEVNENETSASDTV